MRGAAQSGYMQDQATLREYEKAKRLGAVGFCGAVRVANPHLIEAFDMTDALVKFDEQRTENDGKCLGQVAKEANNAA